MKRLLPKVVRRALEPVVARALLAWERMESGVSYDPTSRSIKDNPYPTYEKLRSLDPVHRLRLLNGWALTQYEDVSDVLRDHRRFVRDSGADMQYKSLLDMDPPDHTRLRGLVSQAFTSRSVALLEPHIRETVDELLDAVERADRFDLMDALAFPLPVTVIAEMIGVPSQDMDRFKVWSDNVALTIEPIVTDEQARLIQRSSDELFEYFEEKIDERRREPRDDLISALLVVEDEGDRLTHEELLATLLLLLVAGNVTTRNLIGNGMLALLRNPDQLQRLRDDPALLNSALDEMLRYDSPVQLDGRFVAEDVEIRGRQIRKGQRVICIIGAANRDPDAFADPQTLDVGRSEKSHISFGRGIHYCIGAPLALLEGRIAFAGLLDRFSGIRLVSEPEYQDQVVLRGVEALWIEVERNAGRPSSTDRRAAPTPAPG